LQRDQTGKMLRKIILLILIVIGVGIICIWWFLYAERNTERWVHYAKTDFRDYYYDKDCITKVSTNIIMVWSKNKYSKKDKEEIIQSRRNDNMSIDGWDKLDYGIIRHEFDCVNNTSKNMGCVMYNAENIILDEIIYPNPETNKILPGSVSEALLKIVCK
jgi:hypothetical protein